MRRMIPLTVGDATYHLFSDDEREPTVEHETLVQLLQRDHTTSTWQSLVRVALVLDSPDPGDENPFAEIESAISILASTNKQLAYHFIHKPDIELAYREIIPNYLQNGSGRVGVDLDYLGDPVPGLFGRIHLPGHRWDPGALPAWALNPTPGDLRHLHLPHGRGSLLTGVNTDVFAYSHNGDTAYLFNRAESPSLLSQLGRLTPKLDRTA
jgi:hypothetical protein